MSTKYRISEDDYVSAMRLFGKLTSRKIAVLSTLVLFLMTLAVFGSPEAQGAGIGGVAGGLLVLVITRYIISPIMGRGHYRKYKAMHEEFSVELLEDGVRFVTKNSEWKISWDSILKWRQNDAYILIFPMPRIYYILPKSVAADGFDIPSLLDKLTNNVGSPA